jgi:hypothetical protein
LLLIKEVISQIGPRPITSISTEAAMPLNDQQKERLQSLYTGQHKLFLAEHHPDAYARMQKEGALQSYLQDVGTEAVRAYVTMEADMLTQAESMADPQQKETFIEQIPLAVEEIVLKEIVYAPLG